MLMQKPFFYLLMLMLCFIVSNTRANEIEMNELLNMNLEDLLKGQLNPPIEWRYLN
jgi:hypothetical protein